MELVFTRYYGLPLEFVVFVAISQFLELHFGFLIIISHSYRWSIMEE